MADHTALVLIGIAVIILGLTNILHLIWHLWRR